MTTRDELLLTMVRADATHRPAREQFFMVETFGDVTIGHPGLPNGEVTVNKPDVLDLIDLGYLRPTYGSNVLFLDVTNAGFLAVGHAMLSTEMQQEAAPPVTVLVEELEVPADIESERERLARIATDFGWRFGFAQEPDGSWFWLVMDVETDEPIKSGTAPSWQDALLDCVKDLVPPNAEG